MTHKKPACPAEAPKNTPGHLPFQTLHHWRNTPKHPPEMPPKEDWTVTEVINGIRIICWLVPGQFVLAIGKYNPEMVEILEKKNTHRGRNECSLAFCFTAPTIRQLCQWVPEVIRDTRQLETNGQSTRWAALRNALLAHFKTSGAP